MIVETKNLQNVCKKILEAVDSSSTLKVSSTLELKTVGKKLMLNVNNVDYYVSVMLDLDEAIESFRAVVDAPMFLGLVSKVTTNDIELTADESVLYVKANGTYKFPMIYDVDKLIEVPEIKIENETNSFAVNSESLLSILKFNTKETQKNISESAVQKMYYLDEKGCLTFTASKTSSSACINSFNIDTPVKLLLSVKLVKLFDLFNNGDVKVTIGYDSEGNMLKQKVRFENNNVVITAILNSTDAMLNSIPVIDIRGFAEKNYPYNVVFKRADLMEALNRILLFKSDISIMDCGYLTFTNKSVTISDVKKDNNEEVYYPTPVEGNPFEYTAMVDLTNFKNTLDGCTNEYVSLSLGDGRSFVMTRNNIKNVIMQLA